MNVGGEIDLVRHPDGAIANGKCGQQDGLAGRHIESDRTAVRFRVRHQQAPRFPFRMAPQRDAAGIAGRITALVIQPESHAGFLGGLHRACEGLPLGLAFEILVEGNVADHTAESLGLEFVDEAVLGLWLIRPRMNDL